MSRFNRTPQLRGEFSAGEPGAGYYNDLRGVADGYNSPEEALGWLALFERRRETSWPVSILQLGLGAWQHVVHAGDRFAPYDDGNVSDPELAAGWREVVQAVAAWAVLDMDGHGRFPHLQPMPHTYEIEPPWYSAMAQGQGVSFLIRAAELLDDPTLLRDAARAAAPLLAGASLAPGEVDGLVAMTDEGPVLQEYPSEPPAHVLNGWMWALWGLYDLGATGDGNAEASEAFERGVDTLVARLPEYCVGRGWSRYDLYPHPIVNVASPFYHRLHIEMLRATAELTPRHELTQYADQWEVGLSSAMLRAAAVARKVGFRMVRPRRKAA